MKEAVEILEITDHRKLPYRRSVGIMVINKAKLVFVGRRISPNGNNMWQMPQGGMREGETVREAGLRELYEETNLKEVKIIAEIDKWLYYDIPEYMINQLWQGKYRGQQQKWLLAIFEGSDECIDVNKAEAEFSAWKWIKVSEISNIAVPYKKELYTKVVENFSPIIDELISV